MIRWKLILGVIALVGVPTLIGCESENEQAANDDSAVCCELADGTCISVPLGEEGVERCEESGGVLHPEAVCINGRCVTPDSDDVTVVTAAGGILGHLEVLDADIKEDLKVGGTLVVGGDGDVEGDLNVGGSVVIDGELDVDRMCNDKEYLEFCGTFSANNLVATKDSEGVGGHVTAEGDAHIQGNLHVDGTVTFENPPATQISFYLVRGDFVEIENQIPLSPVLPLRPNARAFCSPGDIAISGGFDLIGDAHVIKSRAILDDDDNPVGWVVRGDSDQVLGQVSLRSEVICLDRTP